MTDDEVNQLADKRIQTNTKYLIESKKLDAERSAWQVTANLEHAKKKVREMAIDPRYKKGSILLHRIEVVKTWEPETAVEFVEVEDPNVRISP